MNKQQLAANIWESANKMRSKIEANEYKDYILGFIFYKFLSEREYKWCLDEGDFTEEDIKQYLHIDDEGVVKDVQDNIGYFIDYDDLFSTWLKKGSDFSVDNVRTALSSFSRYIAEPYKRVFSGVFNTLETGLSKLGDSALAQTKAVSDLIQLINKIPMDSKQDYDVLGFVYEYLISKFASNAGKKAGEFYTPHEVSQLMSEIVAYQLKGRETINIYDPTSGSGSLLINIGNAAAKYMNNKNGIVYYAQELKSNTYNLTRMNLVMRGILASNIFVRNGDTLEDDWPYFDENDKENTYKALLVDAVVSNPPYSQAWDPTNKENDPRFKDYGLAPKGKADYAFLLHDLYHLQSDGIMTIVLPHGVLFRGGEEGSIRKNLIENRNIDTIIGLPANIFYGTGIPTIIMVLKKSKKEDNILFIDASKGFIKDGKNNKLRACDIRKILDTFIQRKDVDKFSRKVSIEEIRNNDYNLNIPRYVDSSEDTETWDIYASMFGGIPENELNTLRVYWNEFPSLKETLFNKNGEYYSLKVENIKQTILNNADVLNFKDKYQHTFKDLKDNLYSQLIEQSKSLSIVQTKEVIANDILNRFESISLIDPYEAYEIFDCQYKQIAEDLEVIQSEGFACLNQVDPNMVVKKKNNKDIEVQDGWKGHVLPFDLIQSTYLKAQLDLINNTSNRISEIDGEISSIFDELSEEEKAMITESLNDDNDAFVYANLAKDIKRLKSEGDSEALALVDKLEQVVALNKEQKECKSNFKTYQTEIHIQTKEKIEALTETEIKEALTLKWITPIYEQILSLYDNCVSVLEKQIKHLSKKYEDTYESIDTEIKNTEKSLLEMLDQLTGNENDMAGIREFKKLLGGSIYD